ncbi:hypothetical protein KR50_30360 [Jeotgalibacillus campisalis]|uniref:Uncharacterized protein n=1 Tax=Jeotgalibacillus campisalis TaxID=220754 RepID=A0A0C2VPI5_9BACL|nr:hypothetical protein KR50_30360 [Jeotgalibacillus campisalis]
MSCFQLPLFIKIVSLLVREFYYFGRGKSRDQLIKLLEKESVKMIYLFTSGAGEKVKNCSIENRSFNTFLR